MTNQELDKVSQNLPEPLLPVEKKLICWSLGIGIALLLVLAVLNYYLPATI